MLCVNLNYFQGDPHKHLLKKAITEAALKIIQIFLLKGYGQIKKHPQKKTTSKHLQIMYHAGCFY
jgi:hypothetical protein